MKSFVIAVKEHEESLKSAERCIKSAKEYGLEVEMFFGFTPEDKPLDILKNLDIPVDGFVGKYSRLENCVAAFLSHRALWEKSIQINEDVLIFEHDAMVVAPIPVFKPFNKLISYGKPSYGKYNDPLSIGVNPLISKPYLPGAHAYRINPAGAKIVLQKSKTDAGPTDVFLNLKNFPWIEEYYPWPVEVLDTFTTIQKTEGCLAKHNYNERYKIL
jgi:hypothetical protein